MTTISHFLPQVPTHLICSKGGSHEQQPLNLVCLDPLCRNSPLLCCVCFTTIHKYHKVVALNKFLDDYKRNIGSSNANMLQRKISKSYAHLKEGINKFKRNLTNQIDKFEKTLIKYAEYLTSQSCIRDCVGQQLNLELQPQKINKLKSHNDLERSVRFILNNCFFDSNSNMANASQILKQNEERVCALLDKMVYMTQFCQRSINEALKSLNFANHTLKTQKIQMSNKIDKLMDAEPDPTSLQNFLNQKKSLNKLIEDTGSLVLQQSQKMEHMKQWEKIPRTDPTYLFGKYRHKQLQLQGSGQIVKSNIHGDKYFALGWPNINSEPQNVKQWSIKINKCRDFASENTMAVGISRLSDMKLSHFKGNPTNCLLASSQGYVTLNGKSEKTSFTYRQGDTLHFKYDPYYQTLQISKQNGRKLTLKTLGNVEPVYSCVRFTYASDQVQFV